MQAQVDALNQRLHDAASEANKLRAEIAALQNTIEKKKDVELQCQQAKAAFTQIQQARESLQRELAVQKASTAVQEYEDKIARRESLISDLRKQIQYTDGKNNEF